MLEYDLFDSLRVFPSGIILFDFLFILVATPIEAVILNQRLKFDKRTSAFYAISMNVFSNAIGWMIFFALEPTVFFGGYKLEVINYLLYNRLSNQVRGGIVLAAFITFFATLMVKFALLRILIISLSEPGEKKPQPSEENSGTVARRSLRDKRTLQSTSLFTTTLIANSLSYSAITLIVLFRWFALGNV